ncbi:hypothetical protein ACFSJU_07490 [Paradesertivirga mongoliensis]|uniref:Uncharacterized protein n=1 Tax=Paradesertivirga mongoliensis TaxID=2100740 RepID=A0ABW4ZKC5_9SPHI|nr:hypothetical protein [Pedobacter mongoliensis]
MKNSSTGFAGKAIFNPFKQGLYVLNLYFRWTAGVGEGRDMSPVGQMILSSYLNHT